MPFALTDDHVALAEVAAAFLTDREALAAAREALDGSSALPAWWPEIAALGWLGLHVSEDHGGQGFGLAELAVVVEALGAVVAPVPVVSTAVVVGDPAQRDRRAAPGSAAGLSPQLAAARHFEEDGWPTRPCT